MESFDYIIIGAGSAGCVLANRLSARPDLRILLLEAGGSDRNFWVQMPIGYGKLYHDPRFNWRFESEPVESLGGKISYWPRGKVLGGSSSINAMVYVRGHPGDFEDWEAAGARGWSWSSVAPYFRKMESWSGGDDGIRGGDGPLAVSDISEAVHPLCQSYLRAAAEMGLPATPDYNGERMEGAAIYQITTKGGLRASTARCYLRPAMRRPNLEVRTRAQATRLLLEGKRVTGVEYYWRGRRQEARANLEVLLSAGAVASPQLLQLSGIGPGEVLQPLGIETLHDLPAVGRHLQDHLGLDNLYRCRVPTLNQELGPLLGKLKVGLRYVLTRKGPLSLSVNQSGGFFRSKPELERPDLQLYFNPVSYTRARPGKRKLLSPDPFPGLLIGFDPCRPTSRGHIQLRSPDAFHPPAIHPNYLANEEDWQVMLAGCRFIRRLADMPALKAVIEEEIVPGYKDPDEARLRDHIREGAWTVFHPCCTARMGLDPRQSALDPRLRVHGLEGLRVVDASAFPSITSGNINAPVIMLAEKASALILEDLKARGVAA